MKVFTHTMYVQFCSGLYLKCHTWSMSLRLAKCRIAIGCVVEMTDNMKHRWLKIDYEYTKRR